LAFVYKVEVKNWFKFAICTFCSAFATSCGIFIALAHLDFNGSYADFVGMGKSAPVIFTPLTLDHPRIEQYRHTNALMFSPS